MFLFCFCLVFFAASKSDYLCPCVSTFYACAYWCLIIWAAATCYCVVIMCMCMPCVFFSSIMSSSNCQGPCSPTHPCMKPILSEWLMYETWRTKQSIASDDKHSWRHQQKDCLWCKPWRWNSCYYSVQMWVEFLDRPHDRHVSWCFLEFLRCVCVHRIHG